MDINKYPEFNKIIESIVAEVARKINAASGIESTMPYKCQYVLEEVIKKLQEMV